MSARFRDFHNLLRVLTSIDMSELVAGGVIEGDDEAEWATFRKDPHRWMILAGDDEADKLWAVIERRAPDNIGADLAATKTELAAWKQHGAEQFERARTAEQALWQMQYPPTARAQTLRAVAEEIDCDLGCPHMGTASPCKKYERGEFCGATYRAELLDLAEALERKAAVLHAIETQPALVEALKEILRVEDQANKELTEDGMGPHDLVWMKQARAAIAKATGTPRQ